MDIKFSAKEEKTDKIDELRSNFSVIYLIAIADKHPNLWKQFKQIVAYVDNEIKKEMA